MNFVRAMLAIQDYAAREALSANEVMLLLAIFRVLNDRRWPKGMQKITNNQLLAHTTFYGSKRDETLREARRRLADRGVIAFEAGDRRAKQPEYAIRWEALGLAEEEPEREATPETAPEIGPDFTPKKRGKNGGKPLYNNNPVSGVKNKNAKRDTKGPRSPFAPPNIEQVRAYCAEIGFTLNPMIFLDYYGARGWPVTDWQAALRLWKAREEQGEKRVSAQRYDQRRYTEEEMERGCL